jgi:Tfp pilus assembly protein PilV
MHSPVHFFRPAIAMIELIFAIVIMGIVFLSAPMLISTASTSSQATFHQESIAMIASHTNALLSYAWDEQNTESVNNFTILDTNSSNTQLDTTRRTVSNTTLGKVRVLPTLGTPTLKNATAKSNFAHPSTEMNETVEDDVDDFDGRDSALDAIGTVSNIIDGDYMDQNITITTQVQYMDGQSSSADFHSCTGSGCTYSHTGGFVPVSSASGSRNVKLITTNLTSANVQDKDITLRAFMCNIGSATPQYREGI